jgi:hypothetical protein
MHDVVANVSMRALRLAASLLRHLVLHLVHVALFSLLTALAFRGGLIHLYGLRIVTADGRVASRPRVFARTAVAWAPIVVLVILAIPEVDFSVTSSSVGFGGPSFTPTTIVIASGLALLLLLAGAIVAVLHPERGIQDRLAGTWIVPR